MYILEHMSHKRHLDMIIKDESGKVIYRIKDKTGLFSKTAYIRDTGGNVLAKVRQLPSVTPLSKVECSNGTSFKVSQLFSLRPRFAVRGSGYAITGHIYDTDYTITGNDKAVLRCQKRVYAGRTVFEMEVFNEYYAIEAIAIVVAIEAAKRNLFFSQS